MAALCLLHAGADANGGSYYSARLPGVTVQHISGAAESITVTPSATAIVIAITYNNGTSTALTLVQLVRRHGEANRLLRTKAQGTGASSPAAQSATAVPFIALEGVAQRQIGDAASVAAQAMDPTEIFDLGCYGLVGDTVAPVLNGDGYLIDDQTVSGTFDALALTAPYRVNERGLYCVDLMEAR